MNGGGGQAIPNPVPPRRRLSTRERAETRLFRWFVLPVTHGIFRLLLHLTSRLSPNQVYSMARGCAALSWWLSKSHRGRVLRNLELAYGSQYTPAERVRLAREVLDNFFMTVFDLTLLPRVKRDGNWQSVIRLTPEQHAAFENLAVHDGPVVFHTGHAGSWEVAAMLPAMFGKPFSFVYRPLDHPQVEEDVRKLRSTFGQTVFPKQGAFRSYARVLRDKGSLGVIADQNAGEGCAYLDFFGVPAATEIRHFPLYQKYRPRIVAAFVLRCPGEFAFHVVGPIEGEVRPDADPVEESIRLGQWYLGLVEDVARQYPGQYLWTHKRYARRPPGVPGLYDNLFRPVDPAVLAAQPKTPVPPSSWKVE